MVICHGTICFRKKNKSQTKPNLSGIGCSSPTELAFSTHAHHCFNHATDGKKCLSRNLKIAVVDGETQHEQNEWNDDRKTERTGHSETMIKE